ncbi:MAG: periplasmic heavy metal sensor [Congregibacter sp.]|nr:periplasmic heavy metal sensor [Congregibacter sp.]
MSKRSVSYPMLLISVAINLLLVGALTGEWVSGSRRPPPPMAWATADLDQATRAAIRQILEEQRPIAQSLRQELRIVDQRLMNMVRASDLDADALNGVLSDLRETNAEYQLLLHTSAANVLPLLSPPQRAAVVQRLLRGSPPGRRPHKRPPGNDRPPATH